MIKLKKIEDLKLLNRPDVSEDMRIIVGGYLRLLVDSLCPEEADVDSYNLEKDGYIVVLTAEDNPDSLKEVGLSEGLMGGFSPEWVEMNTFENETVYSLGFMYDNDFMMIFYLSDTLFKDRTDLYEYLQDHIDESFLDPALYSDPEDFNIEDFDGSFLDPEFDFDDDEEEYDDDPEDEYTGDE